jgi:hypothetical protein
MGTANSPKDCSAGPQRRTNVSTGGHAPRCALHNTQRTLRGDTAPSIGAASARRMPSTDKRWGQRYPSSLFQGSFRHGRPRERSRRTVLILEAVQAPNVLGTVSSGREASRRVLCGRSNHVYTTRHPPHAAPSPPTRTCAPDGLLTRLWWGARGQDEQLHVVRASTTRHKQTDDMRLRLCESRWGSQTGMPLRHLIVQVRSCFSAAWGHANCD